jgi:hypothetical protein
MTDELTQAQANETAAATILTWEWDTKLLLRLLYATDFKFAQAYILFDLINVIQHHKGEPKWIAKSGQGFFEDLPKGLGGISSFRRAITELSQDGILEMKPTVRNTERMFRLCPEALVELVATVNPRFPGLR